MDSDGREFQSAEEMWREEVGDGDPLKKSQWYSQGVGYWQVNFEPSFCLSVTRKIRMRSSSLALEVATWSSNNLFVQIIELSL